MSRIVRGRVVRGHGVASGCAADSPYPDGTISMQAPVFARLGVDLSPYHPATLNVDISPLRFRIVKPTYCLSDVRWCDEHPPETFSFCNCRVVFGGAEVGGLVYYPHPETKKTHFQSDHVLEILAPHISGISYGSEISVRVGDSIIFP